LKYFLVTVPGDVLGVGWSGAPPLIYKKTRGDCGNSIFLIKKEFPGDFNAGDSFEFEEAEKCGQYRLQAILSVEV